MYPDYKDLLSAFHAHGVKYLVVGGFAVIYHSLYSPSSLCDPSRTSSRLSSFGLR